MTSKATTYTHGVSWEEAFGVSQGYSVNGTIYVSGQFSHDMEGTFVGEDDCNRHRRVGFSISSSAG